jgi:hypothetical protein
VAARLRQLVREAEHRRAIADYQARHAADQQARIDALLQEAIAVLAGLLGAPGPRPSQPDPARRPARQPAHPQIVTKTCRNMDTELCRPMFKQRGR